MTVPLRMPRKREEMTSLVIRARVMAMMGGSRESQPASNGSMNMLLS